MDTAYLDSLASDYLTSIMSRNPASLLEGGRRKTTHFGHEAGELLSYSEKGPEYLVGFYSLRNPEQRVALSVFLPSIAVNTDNVRFRAIPLEDFEIEQNI